MLGDKKEKKKEITETEKVDVLSVLREWIDKNLENGSIKLRVFVRNHTAYRFTLKRGDEEISYETKNHA